MISVVKSSTKTTFAVANSLRRDKLVDCLAGHELASAFGSRIILAASVGALFLQVNASHH